MADASEGPSSAPTTGSPPDWFDDLWSSDRKAQNAAYSTAMEVTREPVGWAHTVWDDVVENLNSPDNHNRAIAAQVLCNLAASDSTGRVLDNLDNLIEVTRDERFVTARHCLQSLWNIGLAGPKTRDAIVDALQRRYADSPGEKNSTLVRSDIVQSLRRLYDATGDTDIANRARAMVASETDAKYRKKYDGHWKGVEDYEKD